MIFLYYIFYIKYCYGDQIKEVDIGRICSTHGDITYAFILVGRPGRKRPLGKPRHMWVAE